MLTDEKLSELKELEAKATHKNWMENEFYSCVHTHSNKVPLGAICYVGNLTTEQNNANIKFIAQSRNVFRELVSEVQRLRGENMELLNSISQVKMSIKKNFGLK